MHFHKVIDKDMQTDSMTKYNEFSSVDRGLPTSLRFIKQSEEFRNRNFPSIAAICRFPNVFQRLTVPRMIDRFGPKRCQKKRKDMDYKHTYLRVFSNTFCCTVRT